MRVCVGPPTERERERETAARKRGSESESGAKQSENLLIPFLLSSTWKEFEGSGEGGERTTSHSSCLKITTLHRSDKAPQSL